MIAKAWDEACKWFAERWPITRNAVVQNATAWWDDLEENPRLHFISMVFGMVVLYAVKFAVWLVA